MPRLSYSATITFFPTPWAARCAPGVSRYVLYYTVSSEMNTLRPPTKNPPFWIFDYEEKSQRIQIYCLNHTNQGPMVAESRLIVEIFWGPQDPGLRSIRFLRYSTVARGVRRSRTHLLLNSDRFWLIFYDIISSNEWYMHFVFVCVDSNFILHIKIGIESYAVMPMLFFQYWILWAAIDSFLEESAQKIRYHSIVWRAQ